MTLATYHALDFITFRVFLNDCTGINFTFLLKILSFFTLNYAIPNQIKIILVTHLIIFILARDLKGKIIAFIFLPKEMISYVAICSCTATGVKIFQTKSEREYNYYFQICFFYQSMFSSIGSCPTTQMHVLHILSLVYLLPHCDRTAQNNSVISPKPVHMAIKQ
jgi:hypothetical protein